jgi:DNA-binding MarR family transcriptional regulator
MHESLSRNERKVLYKMFRRPLLNNRELAQEIGMNQSTLASIRQRLHTSGYFKTVRIPMMQDLGCEMLVVIHTEFNPAIPLEQRVKITRKSIEVYDELVYSVGETHKGFSISLVGDYTSVSRIGDVRTETFAKMSLLEGNFPNEVVFPFAISRIERFMDFAPVLASVFEIADEPEREPLFVPKERMELSKTERLVYQGLVEHPEMTDTGLGRVLPVSRHTVASIRKDLEARGLVRTVLMPDLRRLGFKVICFYHVKYSPKRPLDIAALEPSPIMNANTFFMASRKYETIMLSVYTDYDMAKMDNMRKVQFLKENGRIDQLPVIHEYSVNNMAIIKDLTFGPITRKITGP